MKIRLTIEADADTRRGINARMGKPGRATAAEVRIELGALWSAHCDDLREEVDVNECRDERDMDHS